jgi:hypothetical protein
MKKYGAAKGHYPHGCNAVTLTTDEETDTATADFTTIDADSRYKKKANIWKRCTCFNRD